LTLLKYPFSAQSSTQKKRRGFFYAIFNFSFVIGITFSTRFPDQVIMPPEVLGGSAGGVVVEPGIEAG